MKKPKNLFVQLFVLLSYNMGGKMKDILSLSTCCTHCARCNHRHNLKPRKGFAVCICLFCFAVRTVKQYTKGLLANLIHNTNFLTVKQDREKLRAVALEVVKALEKNDTHYFRIESFGDIQNTDHAYNYFLICNYIKELATIDNYPVFIGWWTKNYDLILSAWDLLTETEKENNRAIVTLLLSSTFINIPVSKKIIDLVINKTGLKVKVFTVYTEKFIKENNIEITCGAKCCATCGRCYDPKKFPGCVYVNEQLKNLSKANKKLLEDMNV